MSMTIAVDPRDLEPPRDLVSRRWWALGAVFLTVLCVGIDSTVLSVALPTLAKSLRASEPDLQWFSSGYFLVLTAAMLPAGLLGDRYGHKKVFLLSLGLFAVGSAACAFSSSVAEFMAARVLLGLAGAGVIVMAISSLTVLFSREERPKAVGILAAGNFLAMPIGPILGGWILSNYWWGWVFLVNVPVALIGLVAAAALLPEFRALERPGLDLTGVGASVLGLVAVTYGLIRAGEDGWSNPGALLMILLGIAILVGFLAWERRLTRRPSGQPLLDMTLFNSASFTWGAILAAISFLALIGVLFTMPQYFQGVLGTTAMGSGLRLLPLVGGVLLGAVPAAEVAKLVGAKIAVAGGFGLLVVGLSVGAATSVDSSGVFVATWMMIVGTGMGLALATSTSAALVELSPDRSGVGSGVLEAVDEIGGPVGIAILGSVVSAGYIAHLSLSGLSGRAAGAVRQSVFGGVEVANQLQSSSLLTSVRTAFVHGMDIALLVSAGIALAGVILALLYLPRTSASQAPERAPAAKAPHARDMIQARASIPIEMGGVPPRQTLEAHRTVESAVSSIMGQDRDNE
jgi:DHA2 family multidrug resistance protein-like MFS transporter